MLMAPKSRAAMREGLKKTELRNEKIGTATDGSRAPNDECRGTINIAWRGIDAGRSSILQDTTFHK
jgi:hypothetical protein